MVTDHLAEFEKAIRQFGFKYDCWQIFEDFCELACISFRQPFEKSPELEAKYMETIGKYKPEETQVFPQLLAITANALEANPRDFLGECFHKLELHNKYRGQFFTPFHVSRLMAEIGMQEVEEEIRNRGYISLSEPTCGAGGMIIAASEIIKAKGMNPTHCLWVVAQDIDRKCCCMTYIQLSLLAIPAAVIWGDTLKVECREQWLTAGYYLGGWHDRFKWEKALRTVRELCRQDPAPEPPPSKFTVKENESGQLEFGF